MSRLEALFRELSARDGRALIAYLAVGDPDLETSLRLAEVVVDAGADALELGVPYSDPLADGPTIQAAGQRALAAGFRLDDLFRAVAHLRARLSVPLLAMTYVNPVLQRGAGRFAAELARAGGDGLLVPDLPPEEAGELRAASREAGLDFIPFLAPTSTDERMRLAAEVGSGFVYCVSVTGVTGARRRLPAEVTSFLARVRERVPLPVAVGFGVSTPASAARLRPCADAIVVGSALVAEIGRGGGEAAVARRMRRRVRQLKAALAPGRALARPGVGVVDSVEAAEVDSRKPSDSDR